MATGDNDVPISGALPTWVSFGNGLCRGPVCRDQSLSLAEELRKLSDQLQHGASPFDALHRAQQTLLVCWEHRELPIPCVELKDFLQLAPIQEEAEVKLLKPNDESTVVGFILCHAVAKGVVKYRGDVPFKATREECHFLLADLMAMSHVVAPCLAVELSLLGSDGPVAPATILESSGCKFDTILH